MFDLDRWAEIWASIRSNKLRTLLSGLTISLALFVFITLFGLSKGLQNGFEIEFFPPNVKAVRVNGGKTTLPYRGNQADRLITLKLDDYRYIKNNFKDRINIIVPSITRTLTARNVSEYGTYSITGTNPQEEIIMDLEMKKGRFLEPSDGEKLEKNVVIGRLVEKDLYKNGSALGKTIQLGSTLYRVIGVFTDEDGDDEERKIFLPIQTMQVIYGTPDIDRITILPPNDKPLSFIDELANDLEKELKIRHQVNPNDFNGIRVFNPVNGLKTTDMFFTIFTILVFIIGIGSLIAGIVSIGNMMVFSVKERTKEIGIRKALGARPSNIIGLILQEAMLITFIFGIAGIVIALLFVNSIGNSLEKYLIIDPKVQPAHIALAAGILFFSGFMAGFIPAYRAARIRPIEALRDE